MVPRASTRSRWVSGVVVTTTTASTRFSPPVSNSSGTSTTTTGAPDRFRILEEFLAGGAEHRMDDLLELLHGGGIVHHPGGELCAVDLAVDGRAGKRRLDRRRRLAFIDFVNRRIGVVDGNAGLREQFCGGGFSHSDRAGQSKDQHSDRRFSLRFQTPSSRSLRRNASSGSSGRPRMVKWSPSMRSNRCTPSPSS